MACFGLLLRLNIHCILLYNCQYYGGALASSIFMQQVHIFFWGQYNLLVSCRNAC